MPRLEQEKISQQPINEHKISNTLKAKIDTRKLFENDAEVKKKR